MLDDIIDGLFDLIGVLFGGNGKSRSRSSSSSSSSSYPSRRRVPCDKCHSRTDMIGCTNQSCANYKRKR